MVFLAKGTLPWLNVDPETLFQIKEASSVSEICSDLPPVYKTILTYIKELRFE
jgi:hypothetical protein